MFAIKLLLIVLSLSNALVLKQYDVVNNCGIAGDGTPKEVQSLLVGVVVVAHSGTDPFTLTNTRTGEVSTGNPAMIHVSAGDTVAVQYYGPNNGGTIAGIKVSLPFKSFLPTLSR